jgi:hypothetical protein
MSDDLEIERLLAMSGEELRAEARAEGIDIEQTAREMAQQFRVIAQLVRERDAAREEVARLRTVMKAASPFVRFMDKRAASPFMEHIEWPIMDLMRYKQLSEAVRRALEAPDAD